MPYNWFSGNIDRDIAAKMLENRKIGTFLIRTRVQHANEEYKSAYALSLKYA